ncbi:hypothetical protein J6590_047855 [Homalodisca vitripennis]|nr:hypothetical protein J6590_047855 [Homalodisca vitripennis]
MSTDIYGGDRHWQRWLSTVPPSIPAHCDTRCTDFYLDAHRLAILTVGDEMFHDAYSDTRCTDFYLDARRHYDCRGTRYVNECGITLPTLFDSGHLFDVYPTA